MNDSDQLQALNAKPWPARTFGYLKLMGPGFMQSAMTLGGGTAFAAIFAGAAFGYDLLWVAPMSMALGIIVLSAVAYQTLSTDQDPFEAMRQHAGGFFAWGWAISGIVSSIIWQFAQYALAASMMVLLVRSRLQALLIIALLLLALDSCPLQVISRLLIVPMVVLTLPLMLSTLTLTIWRLVLSTSPRIALLCSMLMIV